MLKVLTIINYKILIIKGYDIKLLKKRIIQNHIQEIIQKIDKIQFKVKRIQDKESEVKA